MLTRLDLDTARFAAPVFLPLLLIPAALLLLWFWQLLKRRRDIALLRVGRQVPGRESMSLLGDLPFWLCLIIALAATIVALARPVAVVSLVGTAGIDLVVLQDGSASMRVKDIVAGSRMDRWQRSMLFLRTIGESLRWEDDRVALALFASIATPQVRLTRDPNTYFFFLDHLGNEPPFRLADDTTWDTNIERGIYWGLKLIEKDEEIASGRAPAARRQGAPSPPPSDAPRLTQGRERANARAFVLISDGQAWSGEVAKSIELAQNRGVPIYVVGVGTTGGGLIPDPDVTRAALTSALDRASLATIASAGGGRYFELDREDDRDIANAIISETRRRASTSGVEETTEDLYWRALAVAAIFVGLGVLFLRDRAALGWQLAGAVGVLALLLAVM